MTIVLNVVMSCCSVCSARDTRWLRRLRSTRMTTLSLPAPRLRLVVSGRCCVHSSCTTHSAHFHLASPGAGDRPTGRRPGQAGGQSLAGWLAGRLVELYRPRHIVELTLVGRSRSGKQINHAEQEKKNTATTTPPPPHIGRE